MLESLTKDKHWIEYPFGSLFYVGLVRHLKDVNIHPNWYTLSFIMSALISGVFFSMNYFFVSYLFWRFSVILDLVDGPIARYKKQTSLLGEYLDNMGHILSGLFLIVGTVYGSFSKDRMLFALIACFLFLLVYTVKYVNYTVFGVRNKIRLNKNKYFLFFEKRVSDFFDIDCVSFL